MNIANKKRKTSSLQLDILRNIFSELDRRGVTFAMIHGRDIFNGNTSISDVDIVFDESPTKTLSSILYEMQRKGAFRIVQCLHYDVSECYYYILSINDEERISFLHLDCMYDPAGINGYFFPAPELLVNLRKDNEVPSPSIAAEFLYLVIKKARKGKLDRATKSDIETLFSFDRSACLGLLAKYLDPEAVAKIVAYIENGTMDEPGALEEIHRQWQQHGPARKTSIRIRRLAHDVIRKIHRIIKPSGIFIVFLGPDGSGKSTIAEGVLAKSYDGFRKTFHFHWRPELLPRPGGKHKSSDHDGAPEPALESKYGLFMSLIRFSYYYGDFILGYWIRIYPRKAATSLVIGERYYYDILVHPERYGFSLPAWVYRVLIYFVPKPDMTILLSNEAEVIAERKDELPVEEIRRQLNAYREVIRLAGNGIEIRTEGSIDDVVQNVSQTVLNKTADKNRCCDS